MQARLFQPAKTAMQQGRGKIQRWLLEFEPEQARRIEPLMGWTSSGDTKQQLRLWFDSQEEGEAYCQRHGIMYTVERTQERQVRAKAYADNFAYRRAFPWTH
ncbi:MAG: ETC complex I subunit [Rhodospirillales bacterium]